MTGIKICGINSDEAFDTCVDLRVDWIGFVFYPPSPRCLTPEAAASLSARQSGLPLRVGLFVEPKDHEIAQVLAVLRLDVLQLYTGAARAAELRARFAIPVWRAVGVGSIDDLPRLAEGADGFVVDAPPAANATRPGGNANRFDWSVLGAWRPPTPWLLAGGLTPANVRAAIRHTAAPGVDVSSGVERAPGIKEPGLIRAFVANVRDTA